MTVRFHQFDKKKQNENTAVIIDSCNAREERDQNLEQLTHSARPPLFLTTYLATLAAVMLSVTHSRRDVKSNRAAPSKQPLLSVSHTQRIE